MGLLHKERERNDVDLVTWRARAASTDAAHAVPAGALRAEQAGHLADEVLYVAEAVDAN
jgi:hypothetical protein